MEIDHTGFVEALKQELTARKIETFAFSEQADIGYQRALKLLNGATVDTFDLDTFMRVCDWARFEPRYFWRNRSSNGILDVPAVAKYIGE